MAISLSQNNVVMKKKQKKQGIEMLSTTKRFLPVTIPEMLHKTSNDGSKLSLSALVQMKPFFILYPTEKKKIICICIVCFFVREIFSGYRKCFLLNFSIHDGFVQMHMGTNRVLLQEFFFTEIHFMQGRIAITRNGVTRKKNSKRINHTGDLFRKNLQLRDVY